MGVGVSRRVFWMIAETLAVFRTFWVGLFFEVRTRVRGPGIVLQELDWEIVGAQAGALMLFAESYCRGVGIFGAGESSEGAEKASSADGFNTTISTRRFLARPSWLLLEATGWNSA